ncbi:MULTISPECIES: (R)-mandelonitrile lyase [Pseudomonas]|uniref:Cupin n=1 Tax=Pseudomonas fluorescens TaxID=294 RepID=A0A159ZWL1_PSEFL|nr:MULTISPECIES: cupin domain-containing protein [Pseudomonas]AMZ71339.1 cupin [Pseudomonas fluorescens]MBD9462581.1 cupin domain-containing protein [Pseudomonas sp. Pdm06]
MRITFAMSMLSVILMVSSSLHAAEEPDSAMQIVRNGEQPSVLGSSRNFVGTVRVDPLFAARPPSRVTAGAVTFQPGARSAWHTHPAGQNLIVTAGVGWIQQEGGEKIVIKPGDVIWTPPGVKHWHGATDTTGLTHLAIQEVQGGKNVEWLEPVTDEQYGHSR